MKITKDVYLVGSGGIRLSNQRDCHVYLLEGAEDELALIDAGVGIEPERVLENVEEEGFNKEAIEYILLTHTHSDHAGGCKYIKGQTDCQIVTSKIESRLLKEGTDEELGLDMTKRSGVYPEDYEFPHAKADKLVGDGDTLQVGKYDVKSLIVPGHSKGSVVFYFDQNDYRIMFSADVVFTGGTIGLGNWPGSTLADYRQNIGKLGGLSVDALLPGHFLWTLEDGQTHLDNAIENLKRAWVPPMWQHQHPAM